jgi:glycosyltransferase involved in cell wall biosynthesis
MSDRPLTVLLAAPNLDVGGVQETTLNLANYLPRTGCAVVVASLLDGPLRPEIERLGTTVELLPPRRHRVLTPVRFGREVLAARAALARVVDRHRVDVVLQTQTNPTLSLLVLSLRLQRGLQVWWTIQNTVFLIRGDQLTRDHWTLGPKRFVHRWLYRLGARMVTGVIAVSDETARTFREFGAPADQIVTVCNAVDTERYPAVVDRDAVRATLGFGPDEHLMVMVGTFKRQKGHTHLVRAAAAVLPERDELHLLLVGDGELAAPIRDEVSAAGLSDRVHFLGTRRDVPELLAASDSFVLPSLWEGLPLALVEAMAAERPVIATAVSGTEQVMIDGTTGWVVPPGDASALADAMRELLADPARAATMAGAARHRAEGFSCTAQAQELVALFRDAAVPSAPPRVPMEATA